VITVDLLYVAELTFMQCRFLPIYDDLEVVLSCITM